jgi:hypothetical protein
MLSKAVTTLVREAISIGYWSLCESEYINSRLSLSTTQTLSAVKLNMDIFLHFVKRSPLNKGLLLRSRLIHYVSSSRYDFDKGFSGNILIAEIEVREDFYCVCVEHMLGLD